MLVSLEPTAHQSLTEPLTNYATVTKLVKNNTFVNMFLFSSSFFYSYIFNVMPGNRIDSAADKKKVSETFREERKEEWVATGPITPFQCDFCQKDKLILILFSRVRKSWPRNGRPRNGREFYFSVEKSGETEKKKTDYLTCDRMARFSLYT